VLDRLQAPGDVVPGQRVRAHWRVGDEERDGVATVEEVTPHSWTVRLDGPVAAPDFSRRREHRRPLSLAVTVAPAFSGSLGGDPAPARTLDISPSGMKLALEAATVSVGDVLEVRLEHAGRVERLVAYVVWEQSPTPGTRTAGLRFRDEVQLDLSDG
jgi:hypothetical protein